MKRLVLFFYLIVLLSLDLFAQQPVVAVAPFDVIGNAVTAEQASEINDVFFVRLGNTRRVELVNRSIVDRILKEHQFQAGDWSNDNKTAELAKALNASWIVQGNIRKTGNNLLIIIQFYDITTFKFEGGTDIRIANADEAYNKMDPLVESLIKTISDTVSSAVPARAQTSTSTTSANTASANILISANAGWLNRINGGNENVKENSEAIILFGSETIQNRLVNIMTLQVNLAKGNVWRIGQFENYNDAIIGKLKTASGIRFSVLGDGAVGWKIMLPLINVSDDTYHEAGFSTKKGLVTKVDIPFSKFKQPDWEGRHKVSFNKNNIYGLYIQRFAGDGSSLSGSSTIKIFDFEIY